MLEIKESIKQNESVFLRGFGTFLRERTKKKNWKKYIKKIQLLLFQDTIPKPAKIFKEEVKK